MSPFKYLLLLSFWSIWLFNSCRQLPSERISPFKIAANIDVRGDSIEISLDNDILSPIHFRVICDDSNFLSLVKNDFPLRLAPLKDTSILYLSHRKSEDLIVRFNYIIGDPDSLPIDTTLNVPFPKGRKYRIMQGYFGKFSHFTDFSRYAIDFQMPVGDTITAAADGLVISSIKDYKYGGNDRKWRPYANYITLYHPKKRIFTQYVHLKKGGSFVEIGDSVVANQPIGISGKTGFTSGPHLHFNVLKSTKNGLQSIPCIFYKNLPGAKLKRGIDLKRVH